MGSQREPQAPLMATEDEVMNIQADHARLGGPFSYIHQAMHDEADRTNPEMHPAPLENDAAPYAEPEYIQVPLVHQLNYTLLRPEQLAYREQMSKDCKLGEWGAWSPCFQDHTDLFKKQVTERYREIT